ncbi:MAG: NDP-sugar synthase [Deltaproteobacteria bacterium]|nr:NDP-sugar synthase [Deltaproteobacteria bacterium]MBW1920952.1 NDP-sugar synthase [Deltaproteobacteria bacterium]MBW1935272.1 NDP-sugar synthase [Deltaproteobacteria bacterium]RLB34646.1 MAG: hypothetical protein DRH11_05350 [Deltaproteobacteria bacterium]
MKAMILAAGLGTRLRPLTNEKPKALIPVANQPVIARVIKYLKAHGVSEIVVNAHHHSKQIVNYLDAGKPFGVNIEVRVEREILGTGGGIKNTFGFWDSEPFVVVNADVLTDIDLSRAYAHHKASGALVTLILHDCEPFNQIHTEAATERITKIAKKAEPGALAFTGLHIMDPELLSYIPAQGYFDIIECYRELINRGNPPAAFVSKGHYWRDIGSIDDYIQANKELAHHSFEIAENSRVDQSVKFRQWAAVGPNARLEANVEVQRSILWEDVRVSKGVKIVDSIVTSRKRVESDLISQIY